MSRKKAQVGLRARTVDHLNAWLIMLPSLVLMLFFVWEPLFESVVMSLYKTCNIELVNFIGFKNYISVMGKDDFLQALTNTFSYTFWSLLLGFFLPMVLALLIGETVRSKSFFRTVAYLPNMLPGLAVVILWSAFFSGEKSGVLNILLSHLGIAPQTYLTRSEWVIPIIILIATWKGAGATALIYMAGMSSVSPELYEAAAIDGAGIWQRIIHIMIPAIKKLAGTLLILQIISVFQIMYEPMVLTKGGPDNASLSLMQLTGILAVRLTVEGELPADRTNEVYTSEEVLLTSPEDIVRTVKVVLYFPDQTGQLVGEERRLTVYEGETIAQAVVKALTERPMDSYGGLDEPLLPAEFTALGANTEGGTCYLNLPSSVTVLLPEDAEAQNRMIQGLVDSLCSLEGVEQVQLMLDGEYMLMLGSVPISRPLLPSSAAETA